jgi:outer membrane murein-binding lipoprotein Lpp
MADKIDALSGRVQNVEEALETLSTKVDDRFNAVDEAFLEQRQYTEFGFARLEAKIDARCSQVEAGLEAKIDSRSSQVEAGLEARIDARCSQVEASLEAKLDAGDSRLGAKMDAGFARIERKLGQFIDAQLWTNALVDRQLRQR